MDNPEWRLYLIMACLQKNEEAKPWRMSIINNSLEWLHRISSILPKTILSEAN